MTDKNAIPECRAAWEVWKNANFPDCPDTISNWMGTGFHAGWNAKPAGITREQVEGLRWPAGGLSNITAIRGFEKGLDAVIAMLPVVDQNHPDPSDKNVCTSQTGADDLPDGVSVSDLVRAVVDLYDFYDQASAERITSWKPIKGCAVVLSKYADIVSACRAQEGRG